MKWSKEHSAWHNTTKLGLSHIVRDDLNAKLDGFIELKKDETGEDVLNLFIQAAPGVWYYIGYSKHQLIMSHRTRNSMRRSRPNQILPKQSLGS